MLIAGSEKFSMSDVKNNTVVREYVRRAAHDSADISAEQVQGDRPGYAFRYGPRKPRRKKLSTFNVIIFLLGFAVALVLYISNIIAVNGLVKEINQLEREYERVRNANEILRAELNNRTGLERIGSIAGERLGLSIPAEPPRWISIDKNEVIRLQRELERYKQ
jgi:cell division protein FtsB